MTEEIIPAEFQKTPKRIGAIVLRTVLFFPFLVGLMLLLIQTTPVQRYLVKKATAYLEMKLKTRVSIGHLYFSFPKSVVFENLYVEDLKKDTLLYAGKLRLNISMTKLLSGDLQVNRIKLEQTTAKLSRVLADTVFNFQFVLDAFIPKQTVKPETDTVEWQTSIRYVEMDRVRMVYSDIVTGFAFDILVGHFETDIDKADRTQVGADSSPDAPVPKPELSFQDLELKDTRLVIGTNLSAIQNTLDVGNLQLDFGKIDFVKKLIALKKLRIDRSTATIRTRSGSTVTLTDSISEQHTQTADENSWSATAAGIRLTEDNFLFDNDNVPAQHTGIDFAHLHVQALALDVDSLAYGQGTVAGRVINASLKERSGFMLTKLETEFLYDRQQLSLNKLVLITPGTELRHAVTLRFPSADTSTSQQREIAMDVDLADSKIQVKDLLSFAPALKSHRAFANPNNVIRITWARWSGNLTSLQIDALQLQGLKDIRMNIRGRLTNLSDFNRTGGNLVVTELTIPKNDLLVFFPKATFPGSLNIPQSIRISGSISGTVNHFNPDLLLQAPVGDVKLSGSVQQATNASKARYQLSVQTYNLNMYALLPAQKDVGVLNARFTATGNALDRTAAVEISGVINSVSYKQRTYRDLPIHARFADQKFKVRTNIRYITILPGILGALIRKPVF